MTRASLIGLSLLAFTLAVPLVAGEGDNWPPPPPQNGMPPPPPPPGMGRGFNGDRMQRPDVIDPSIAGIKLDCLPLGADKRQAFNVPVGGVDRPDRQGNGWKMELIYKMSPEQIQSVAALREQYAADRKKLEAEAQAQYAALADKVKQLRASYEQRANQVLTGDDKDSKEKIDALVAETNKKNADTAQQTLPLYDLNDGQQRMNFNRVLQDTVTKNARAEEPKLVALLPADKREIFDPIFQQLIAARDNQNRPMNPGFGPGGPGGPGGRGPGGGQWGQGGPQGGQQGGPGGRSAQVRQGGGPGANLGGFGGPPRADGDGPPRMPEQEWRQDF